MTHTYKVGDTVRFVGRPGELGRYHKDYEQLIGQTGTVVEVFTNSWLEVRFDNFWIEDTNGGLTNTYSVFDSELEPATETKRWPVTGSVWWRESTKEWVLEISGVINDCNFSCRHTQPAHMAPEDVAGLRTHYELIEQLSSALRSSAGAEERANAIRAAQEFLEQI